jgi:hypothetical protein
MNDLKTTFIKDSILDTQSNIRSIDVKIAALLAGLVAPLSIFDKINSLFEGLSTLNPTTTHYEIMIAELFFASLGLFWAISITTLVFGIGAIQNPSKHILRLNTTKYTGSFYGANLFKLKLRDAFYNRQNLISEKDLDEIQTSLPSSEAAILNELTFEYLKLIYIRDIKYMRLNTAIRSAAIGLIALVIALLWKAFT